MPRCAVCGQDNPGGFRFCGACGASLAGPARAPAEERRLVTVLFCDLVGFTARSDQADPEDVGALLRPYHARFRAEIERLGGTLDKFIGDGVMAVFGAPVAHEDDPERAVRCALGMLTAIEELNLAHPSLDLAVRVGITTGEALVRLGPDQRSEGVVGDVVNTASRLEGVAPAGGVVVGEATFRATRRLFDYQELAPVKVKGKADPVPVWRLEGARSRTGVEAVRRAGTPFVGRQVELDLLKGLFEQTLADRVVRLVTVVGEPGVGKSRFVAELATSVDDQPQLVSGARAAACPTATGSPSGRSGRSSRPRPASWSPTRPPRCRPSSRRPWPTCSPTPRSAAGCGSGWPPWSASPAPTPSRPSGPSCSPPGSGSSRPSPPPARWSW